MSLPLTPTSSSPASRTLNLVALAGLSTFVVMVVALHALEPSLAGLDHTISEFALGRFGWVMTLAFLAGGTGSLALAASFARPRAASILMGVWGVGLIVSAFVPTDALGAPETPQGAIHNIVGALSFLTLGAGLIILGVQTRRAGAPTRRVGTLILVAGALGLASVITLLLPFNIPEGFPQRVMISCFLVGLFAQAARLRRELTTRGAPDTRAAISDRPRSAVFALAALYAGAIVALHALRPDVSWRARSMSAFVHGPFGWMMELAFGALCAMAFATAWLLRTRAPGAAARVAPWLFAAFGAIFLVVTFVPVSPAGSAETPQDTIHNLAGVIGVLFASAGAITAAIAFRKDPQWLTLATPALALGVAAPAIFLVMVFFVPDGYEGIPDRLGAALMLPAWMVLVARGSALVGTTKPSHAGTQMG